MNKEKEFEEKILNKLLVDLKDIDKYKSFKNGSFIYDLGYYQGNLLINEIERLNNIINDMEKEIDRLLERQYESEKFAKEQGFDTYLPAKENLLWVKNKLKELKRRNK